MVFGTVANRPMWINKAWAKMLIRQADYFDTMADEVFEMKRSHGQIMWDEYLRMTHRSNTDEDGNLVDWSNWLNSLEM